MNALTFDDNDRKRIYDDGIVTTFAPTSIKIAIDGVEHDCTLEVAGTGPYATNATTTGFFAGPAHPTPAGATVLTYGVHTVEVRVTSADGTTLAKRFPSFRIQP